VRLDIRRIAQIKRGRSRRRRVRVEVVKNKVAAHQANEFDLMYDEGVSAIGSILDEAEKLEITKQSGSWVLFGDEKLGQGRENAKSLPARKPESPEGHRKTDPRESRARDRITNRLDCAVPLIPSLRWAGLAVFKGVGVNDGLEKTKKAHGGSWRSGRGAKASSVRA